MKLYAIPIFLVMLLFSPDNLRAWDAVVVKVLDGDSIEVNRDGKIVEIRLYGIDTPEYKQPFSNKARQFTRKLTYRQTVSVEQMDIDRYGRSVALVYSQGKLVNRELVRCGLAWFYPRYCLAQPLCGELQSLEKQARQERQGLWQDNAPLSPWEWKRRERLSGSISGNR